MIDIIEAASPIHLRDKIHYTQDPDLTKCAVLLLERMISINESECYAPNDYLLTTQDIGNYKPMIRKAALKCLVELGYAKFKIQDDRKLWTYIRNHRSENEISISKANRYWILPESINGLGFVYFVQRDGDGIYKIGYTLNLRSRIKSIVLACGSYVTVCTYIATPHYQEIEAELHLKFAKNRIVGEWFNFDSREMMEVVNELFSQERKHESTIGFVPELNKEMYKWYESNKTQN